MNDADSKFPLGKPTWLRTKVANNNADPAEFTRGRRHFFTFDLTSLLFLVILFTALSVVWYEVRLHSIASSDREQGQIREAKAFSENHRVTQELLKQVLANEAAIIAGQTNALQELAYTTKAQKEAIEQQAQVLNYILTRSEPERRALNLQMPQLLKEQVRRANKKTE